jgi:hypothetical protein
MKFRETSCSIVLFALAGVLILSGMAFAAPKTSGRATAVKADTTTAKADSAKIDSSHQVIAYYFHGNVRCPSCIKIEAWTKETIDSSFADELKSGRIEWRVINTDSSLNEHYVKDYELYSKSVILSDLHNGKQTRWKNLYKIWTLLMDKSGFQTYVRDELAPYLEPTK